MSSSDMVVMISSLISGSSANTCQLRLEGFAQVFGQATRRQGLGRFPGQERRDRNIGEDLDPDVKSP